MVARKVKPKPEMKKAANLLSSMGSEDASTKQGKAI
jgi:hypothetical protein